MIIELMGAAHRFYPQRIGPERLAQVRWMPLEHARWRRVDGSDVVRKRSNPRPPTGAIDGREPASRAPGGDETIVERQSIAAITQVFGYLPPKLRDPAAGIRASPRYRHEFGFSESTARRRIKAALDHATDELAPAP